MRGVKAGLHLAIGANEAVPIPSFPMPLERRYLHSDGILVARGQQLESSRAGFCRGFFFRNEARRQQQCLADAIRRPVRIQSPPIGVYSLVIVFVVCRKTTDEKLPVGKWRPPVDDLQSARLGCMVTFFDLPE